MTPEKHGANKRIAIAFGFGKESLDMLEMLEGKNPLLITVIGPDDNLDARAARIFAKGAKKKIVILNLGKSMSDSWNFDDKQKKWRESNYSNAILDFYKGKKKPFDVLYVGRTLKDIMVREPELYSQNPGLWKTKPKLKSVEFPLWRRKK